MAKTKQPAPPAYWRILEAGIGGYAKGTIVPAADLEPFIGAMHGRGLIEPAPEPTAEPEAAEAAPEPEAEPAEAPPA